MKLKQTLRHITMGLALVLGLSAMGGNLALAADCAGTDTLIIDCSTVANKDTNGDGVVDGKDLDSNGAWKLLVVVIQIMSAGVGIAGVGGIVYGAIRYATAGGNFETAKKALGVITNVGIGLVAYALMFALLNFIIPGGLFAP